MKLVADNEGPQPGDLDEYGNPIEEREHYDPYGHFAISPPPEPEDDDGWQPPTDAEVVEAERMAEIHALDHENLIDTISPAEWENCETPVREWLLANWIPARQMTYLTGAGSAGKSLLGQQLATCVAMGRPFLGVATTKASSLYLTCEDDYEELHRRQKGICAGLGMSLSALHDRLVVASLMGALGNELATFKEDGTMKTSKAWDRLLYTIRARKIGFIVLDNVAHLFTGNENIRNQVASFCGLLNKLASETGAAVLLIGHPNKLGAEYSGSTAWENQVRSRLFLAVPKTDEGTVLDPDARQLSRAKANYAKNGEVIDFRWHEWAFLTEAEMPRNVHDETPQTAQERADEFVFMACLSERNGQGRAVSENTGRNYAPAMFAKMKMGSRVGKSRLEQAMERLFIAGKIERGVVGKGADRHPIYGLKAAEMGAGNARETDPDCGKRTRREAAGNHAGNARETRETHKGTDAGNVAGNGGIPLKGDNPTGAADGTPVGFEGYPDDDEFGPRGPVDPWADPDPPF